MEFKEHTLRIVQEDIAKVLKLIRPHAGENPLDPNGNIFSEIFRILSYTTVNIDVSLWKDDKFPKSSIPVNNFPQSTLE
jgi:hypothetical protein